MPTVLLLCFKVVGYAEITVPQFDNVLFTSHFRLCRQTFDLLLDQLSFYLHVNDSRRNSGVEISKQPINYGLGKGNGHCQST